MTEKYISNRKILLFYILTILIPVFLVSISYLAYTAYRTYSFYNDVKSNKRGWSGAVWRSDKELGFAHIPNSHGYETMPIGADVPARFDKDGFRISIEDNQSTKNNHPVILTLGCSFTYGAATHAKDTFPYLVGKNIDGSTKNAGVSSYGLSQMVIIAKRLIPQHKPDYVLVQYSPWLVNRAVNVFAPSYTGKLPNPHYAKVGNMEIKPPVFQPKIFNLPIDEYRKSQQGLSDFLSFLWNVGLPLFIHDDINLGIYTFASIFNLNDTPTTDKRAVIKNAYAEIQKASKQAGSKMIIVVLGWNHNPVPVQKELLPDDVIVVDAHSALLERLPTIDKESFQRAYNHWRGNPPKLVDTHPNGNAHSIIAAEIVSHMADSAHE